MRRSFFFWKGGSDGYNLRGFGYGCGNCGADYNGDFKKEKRKENETKQGK